LSYPANTQINKQTDRQTNSPPWRR